MAPQIPARQLGRDGPKIPAVGFGLMGLSIGYGAVEYVIGHLPRRLCRKLIESFIC